MREQKEKERILKEMAQNAEFFRNGIPFRDKKATFFPHLYKKKHEQ